MPLQIYFMNWIPLDRTEQLEEIREKSGYSIIFKHSTRCSISLMAKKHFEAEWDLLSPHTTVYFIDVLNARAVSTAAAEQFNVRHESPQLLLIKDGECIYDSSHGEISAADAAVRIGTEV